METREGPTAAGSCPVCILPFEDARVCAGCGWWLRGGYVLGEITAELERAFRERLATARRRFDLRAVVRVVEAVGSGDPGVADRLVGLVRGGAPAPGEFDMARAEVLAGPPGSGPVDSGLSMAPVSAVVGLLLTRMVAGEVERAAVIELTSDAVAVTGVGTDELGVPYRLGPPRTWNWSDLLPVLPSDQDSQWLRLAGGIGVHGGGRVKQVITVGQDGWSAALRPVRDALSMIDASCAVVLVRQVAGWPMVDDGVRALTGHLVRPGGAADHEAVTAVTDTLDELLRLAPLRHGYGLALAEVDRVTRRVRLVTHPLFGADTMVPPGPGTARAAEVTVTAPPTRSDDLTLAVVAPVEDDPRQWRPVALARCTTPPGSAVHVRVALDGPGRVRFLDPQDLRIGGLSWPRVVDRVPDEFGADHADVVFVLELSGADDAVTARLRLVMDLLDLVEAEHPEPAAVRVGLVGYDDHDLLDWRRSQLPVLRTAPAAAMADAAVVLRGWRPSTPRHDYAAPVEDALHALNELAGVSWWRDGATHYLVTIGARPPHPPRQRDDLTAPCPARRDWRAEMDQLIAQVGVRRVAVRGTPAIAMARARGSAAQRADAAWRQLGADALFAMDDVSTRELASALGLPAGYGEQVLPVPLAGPSADSRGTAGACGGAG